jgi:hypothetical protein
MRIKVKWFAEKIKGFATNRHCLTVLVMAVFVGLAIGSASAPKAAPEAAVENPPQKSETQVEKFKRLLLAEQEKLIVGGDGKTTIESIEDVLKPQVIAGIDEITDAKLKEAGRPYYFKIRAIYKGYDEEAECALMQDLGNVKQGSTLENALGASFGVDTKVYPLQIFDNAIISTLPTEANSIALFYLMALRIDDEIRDTTGVFIRYVRNIEKPVLNPSKFIVVSGMHYITVKDAHVPNQRDIMMANMGYGSMNDSASVFDPLVYPLADLMDARTAMDKKDIRKEITLPGVKIKYVSEVIFKGQSNTTITVSTPDNILTERMNFTGRASAVKNGEKIRVYYTIAKDPLEQWEIQAIERL